MLCPECKTEMTTSSTGFLCLNCGRAILQNQEPVLVDQSHVVIPEMVGVTSQVGTNTEANLHDGASGNQIEEKLENRALTNRPFFAKTFFISIPLTLFTAGYIYYFLASFLPFLSSSSSLFHEAMLCGIALICVPLFLLTQYVNFYAAMYIDMTRRQGFLNISREYSYGLRATRWWSYYKECYLGNKYPYRNPSAKGYGFGLVALIGIVQALFILAYPIIKLRSQIGS